MKKLINDPADVVKDALLGIEAAHGDRVRVDHEHKIVYRKDAPRQGKVGLISGGGSGHEPMHGGFVGAGMLDAACAGEVFTSPVPDQMMEATKQVDGGAGVLHIVKNYTGDVMNFEMAAEMAAADAGTEVKAVVTDDDVAVQDSLYTAGRRGVGVTVLLEKIVGAAAEEGRSAVGGRRPGEEGQRPGPQHGHGADVVHGSGRRQADVRARRERDGGRHRHPRRAGSLSGCRSHPAKDVAAMLVDPIIGDLPYGQGDSVIAFVNGMGGTPLIELYVMYNEVAQLLDKAGITIARSLVGDYITSLEMAGCSVTLLKVDDDLVGLWDAPVNTPGLRWGA